MATPYRTRALKEAVTAIALTKLISQPTRYQHRNTEEIDHLHAILNTTEPNRDTINRQIPDKLSYFLTHATSKQLKQLERWVLRNGI